MEWSDDMSLKLIEIYRDKPVLWDPTHMDYKLTKKKVDVWRCIADECNCLFFLLFINACIIMNPALATSKSSSSLDILKYSKEFRANGNQRLPTRM